MSASSCANLVIRPQRSARQNEIARAVVFLASDDSSYITGTELFVNVCCCPYRCIYRFCGGRGAASCHGGEMATQLERAEQAGGSTHRAATLTPQASRLVEGPVLATLLRLAAP